MKKQVLFITAILLFAIYVNAQDKAEIQKTIQKMNNEMAEMMVSGDQETIWGYYAKDVISMPSYQPMMKGIDACIESSNQMMASGVVISAFKSTNTDIMVSGDFIVDIGTYEITMTLPQMGDMPYTDNGKYMTIWETQDDGALIVVAETWNTDTNPWEQMQEMEGHE